MNRRTGAASPKNGPIHSTQPDGTTRQEPSKEHRILALFAEGMRLNRFQAARHGDTCLNTTISDLQRRYGFSFARDWQQVTSRGGHAVRVRRYWLAGDALERARVIVAQEVAQ